MTNAESSNDLVRSTLTALRLMDLPDVAKAKKVIREFFFLPHARSDRPDVLGTIDQAVEEMAFVSMLAVAGSDALNPQLAMYEARPYVLRGLKVPGSRYGYDNGDRAFRHFFVSPAFRYEIRGRQPRGAESTNIVLEACEDKPPGWGYPLTFLRLDELTLESDGSFLIEVDGSPRAGRKNHLWLPPGAAHVLIRDTCLDWNRQLPTELAVRRVSGPSSAAPLSFETMARLAPPKVIEHAMHCLRFYDWGVGPIPINTVPPPLVRPAPPGEVPWGMTGVGRFSIEPDEAMIITLDPIGAQYLGAMTASPWLVGTDFATRTGTLNIRQASHNPDGSISYVVAARDPGVQNWLDTGGLLDGELLFRWEMLQRVPDPQLAVRGSRIVELGEAGAALPFPAEVFGPEQRRKQIADRLAGYRRRMAALFPSEITE